MTVQGDCSYRQVSNIRRTIIGNKICRSLRCSWSIACWRCSNHIFILDLTHGFIGLGKDKCKTRRGAFKFGDLAPLILEVLRYVEIMCKNAWCFGFVFTHYSASSISATAIGKTVIMNLQQTWPFSWCYSRKFEGDCLIMKWNFKEHQLYLLKCLTSLRMWK